MSKALRVIISAVLLNAALPAAFLSPAAAIQAASPDNLVWSWGSNRYGQLGHTYEIDGYYLPLYPIDGLRGVMAIAAGDGFSLALTSEGTVWGFGADFSGLADNADLFISDVGHQAVISVDERGTEAAAAAMVVTAGLSHITFTMDHPFIYLIRDIPTGTILFAGRVMNPAA